MQATIHRSVDVIQTPRLQQMMGLFDVPPAKTSEQSWNVNLELPAEWNIGVIVGPSGAGKSTVASELFGAKMVAGWDWPNDKCLLDGFPAAMSIKDVTGLLSSVGFSSPPFWMRPFRVLSNGQQFRANLARTLAEQPALAVVDEFTSVVDRTVAQIGSAAVAKTVRRRGQKFVAVTCHYDVLDWLEPDWIYEPHTGKLEVADAARGLLRRRPAIDLEIVRVRVADWALFKGHHYLTSDIHRSAKCFVGLVRGQPAAFTAVLPFPHRSRPGWREHRTVCLPDFQGVGIGNAMSEYVASIFSAHKPYRSCTSHPSMIRHRVASKLWRLTRKPSRIPAANGRTIVNSRQAGLDRQNGRRRETSNMRLTASFEYVGPTRPDEAQGFAALPAGAVLRRVPTAPLRRTAQSA